MLLELVTPLMIATSPVTIDVKLPVYSHDTQTTIAFLDGGDKDKVSLNSTRTYDPYGNPRDADFD